MTNRLFLHCADADRQMADQIKRELVTAGFMVDPYINPFAVVGIYMAPESPYYGADAVVVLLSDHLLKDEAAIALLKNAADTGKPIFPLYTGNLLQLQIKLPDELQYLAGQAWYEAADAPSWLSALLSESEDSFADRITTARDIPDELWNLSGTDDESTSMVGPIASPGMSSSGGDNPKPAEPQPQPRPQQPPPSPIVGAESPSEPILFSSYSPKEAAPNTWLALYGYVYRHSASALVAADADTLLGEKASDYREIEQPAIAPVSEGALITATPTLPGFQFNPPSASIMLLEDWHRFDFKLRAATAPVNQAANGKMTFSVEGVIVADIPLSVFVSPQTQRAGSAASAGQLSAGVSPYRAVFCSYSHKDTAIVERVERAIKLLGYTYLRDATTLRSGEDWNAALMKMIDQADIFQLFWSSNSSQSKYVRQEWEYALKNKGSKANFIRPVYWEEPMPNVPDELGMLHFEFEPTLDDF